MKILSKQRDQDFIILNLTDTQLSDAEWDPAHDHYKILTGTIQTLIERVHPDLITVSGDLAWAEEFQAYRKLAAFLDDFQIPWAPVWGNHDNQGGPENIEAIVQECLKSKYCIYERGNSALGNGNYVIGIEEEGRLVEALLMMDSHDRFPYTDESGITDQNAWAKLWPEQLVWYRQQIEELKSAGCKDTTMILHIPIYAYRAAFEAAFRKGLIPREISVEQSYDGTCWNPGYERSFGVNYEDIASYPADEGAFGLIKELGSTKTILCGHDHVNNWVISYQGVRFVYGLKTGPGCYWREQLNGGTVLRITSEGVAEVSHEYVDPASFTEKKA